MLNIFNYLKHIVVFFVSLVSLNGVTQKWWRPGRATSPPPFSDATGYHVLIGIT